MNDQIEKGVSNMLVLTRKNRETVVVTDSRGLEQLLKVTVLEIRRGKVTLGIEGEREVPVYRGEIWKGKCLGAHPCGSEPGHRAARRSNQSRRIKTVFAK
jgi:carbon storage regulator CsrA